MAQFVTHIQPTLLEASQGHLPYHHHHQVGMQHSSHLPHSGHNLPSPPTTQHHPQPVPPIKAQKHTPKGYHYGGEIQHHYPHHYDHHKHHGGKHSAVSELSIYVSHFSGVIFSGSL